MTEEQRTKDSTGLFCGEADQRKVTSYTGYVGRGQGEWLAFHVISLESGSELENPVEGNGGSRVRLASRGRSRKRKEERNGKVRQRSCQGTGRQRSLKAF